MKSKYCLALVSIFLSRAILAQSLPEKSDNEAWSYEELMASYKQLDQNYLNASFIDVGPTDAGPALSLFLIQKEPFNSELSLSELAEGKLVTLINNGIHPGESCGMDASLLFAKEVLEAGGPEAGQLIAIIPVYNIGGSLQRRPNTRANQNGPVEQGFRGNASNRDLNRDFIKADALNTFSFWALYQQLRPHIFIDTHTSNGADYPYKISLIASQKDKLAPPLARFLEEKMAPALYEGMAKNWPMIPYVNVFGRTPNDGYAAFMDLPRYASGYTALFHSLGFITEAHMFKPYPDRVAATFEFLNQSLSFAELEESAIKEAFKAAQAWEFKADAFPVAWTLDSTDQRKLPFNSYDYSYTKSSLGNYQRLQYDRTKEIALEIDYYPSYRAKAMAAKPKYYVIPQAWRDVILRLQYHNIQMTALDRDTLIQVASTYLKDWEHQTRPYEGHFRTDIKAVQQRSQKRKFFKGDYLVSTDQANSYFLVSVLDPMAADSYLSWGFFDIIFQQKEYFSPYVFEDMAIKMLEEDPKLEKEFELWKKKNPKALSNAWATLSFFYQKSEYYEPEHLRYPIASIP